MYQKMMGKFMYSCEVNFTNVFRSIFLPFYLRIRLGEGGITLFNVTHTWFATHNFVQTIIVLIISILVLCALYSFNDYWDRKADMLNPKKDQKFVLLINQNSNVFLFINFILKTVLLIAVYLTWGYWQLIFLFLLFVVNIIYSVKVKSIPIADIAIVCVWGAAITLFVPTIDIELSIIAGIMTGIAHIYQMRSDKDIDAQNNVTTSISRFPKWAFFQQLVLCLVLGVIFFFFNQSLFMIASALTPFLLYVFIHRNEQAWFYSRAYFAVAWIILLFNKYGSI